MINFFVVEFNDGNYYNIAIDGGTRDECEEYLYKISNNVRFYKEVDSERKYKNYNDLGFGKLYYCKKLNKLPKNLERDKRHKWVNT